MLQDERGALDLPMRLVVLTIVGMAGLASMIMFIGDMNVVPRSMHADIIGINNSTASNIIHTNSGIKNVTVQVFDVDGIPVEGVTVILYGLHSSASGLTGMDGKAMVRIDTSALSVHGEGYLKLMARIQGFVDYKNDFALKVVE